MVHSLNRDQSYAAYLRFDTAQESRLTVACGYGQLPAAGLHDLFGQHSNC